MKISVITTVYNRPEHLRLFLCALAAQTRLPDEVVVADDGSDPAAYARIQELVASSGLPAKLVRQEHDGYRLSAARNLAVRASSGDYLVFADCDIALLPGTLAVHEQNAAPGRILVGNRALLGEKEAERLFSLGRAPTASEWDAAYEESDHTDQLRAQVLFRRFAFLRRLHLAKAHKPKLIGCHFSLPKADMERVNGFDEAYVGWGYEDDDFIRRLYSVGVRSRSVIVLAPAMHIWHPSLAPTGPNRRKQLSNRAYFRAPGHPAFCVKGLVQNS